MKQKLNRIQLLHNWINYYTQKVQDRKTLKKEDFVSFQNKIWNQNWHIKKLKLEDLAQWFHTIWHVMCNF